MKKIPKKLDREAVRKTLVMMLLSLDAPGDAGVRVLVPALTRLLRGGKARSAA